MGIKLAFFDVDGVIIDSYESIWAATNQFLQQFGGRTITPEEFREGLLLPHWEDAVREWGVNYEPHIHDPILESYFLGQLKLCRPFNGAEAILGLLKGEGIPIYLISAGSITLTERKIVQADLRHLIDGIHSTERKHFKMITLCIHHNVAVGDCLFVTDTARDLRCGREACIGHQVAITSQFSTREQLQPLCHKLVESHVELAHHLAELVMANLPIN